MKLFKTAKYALAGWLPGGRCHCVMCGHRVWCFMPYMRGSAGVPELMRVINTVGSDPDWFECPRCGAHDRERHLLMYLEKTDMLMGMRGKAVLHFAPEKRLALRISDVAPARYVPCDLYPSSPDVQRVDMLQMQFADQSFDVVIANHVLEHVDDDLKALKEIHRVLKSGGHAILQTPYSAKLHRTWQDPGIDTDAARLQAYGQADHVRLFGRDIFDRIVAAGFECHVQQHADLLGDVDARSCGVNPIEPLFLFRKPE
ncbi:methyltransferase domain-containing protein [Dyella ginsengisoli]|uniref:Methyltransferase domain-containing protein n=1 Tax=Dyella ginsengisoli TaxID=363848 RepID=A0ABW8JST3_9GAMM